MAPHLRSPLQIQTPVPFPDALHILGYYQGGGSNLALGVGGRQVGRRRVFVQTETGNVLGIELDRAEKVDAVKKKVQAALCVPTEHSDLLFGDHVLDKDLSEVRQDSPLLLTRGLHRSSSTPCLSPAVTEGIQTLTEYRNSQPIEIVGGHNFCLPMKKLIRETIRAIESGVQPLPATGGLGGAYYFRNRMGESVAIVKPTDEEPFAPNNPKGFVGRTLGQPGLKRSIRVGETGVREVAAYILDHDHYANVPRTALVKATHHIFNVNADTSGVQRESSNKSSSITKICSYQQYVKHDFDASEHGASRFPVSQVHRIGILDVRLLNTDRHGGNILIRRTKAEESRAAAGAVGTWELALGDEYGLVPIDHGLCLPETLEDPYFEWLHWPQSSLPFSDGELQYIELLDPFRDAEILRSELPMIREASLRVLVVCTILLKRGASAGLNLAEIGSMMSRELLGLRVEEELSELESICMLAKLEMEQEESWLDGSGALDGASSSEEDFSGEQDHFQFDLDLSNGSGSGSGAVDDDVADGFRNHHPSYGGTRNLSLKSPVGDGNFPPKAFRSPISGGTHFSSSFSSSPMSSPRFLGAGGGSRGGLPALLMLQETHPLEGNADPPISPFILHSPLRCYPSSRTPAPPPSAPPALDEKKTLRQTGSFNGSWFFPRPPSRAASLHNKFRCPSVNKDEIRRVVGTRGAASAFEMARKSSCAGGRGSGDCSGVSCASSSSLRLSDMNDRAWAHFLNCFEDILPEAFARRKAESAKSMQRLGTSCRF